MLCSACACDEDIGERDASEVTDMTGTFDVAASSNEEIDACDTSKGTEMVGTFNAGIDDWGPSPLVDVEGISCVFCKNQK